MKTLPRVFIPRCLFKGEADIILECVVAGFQRVQKYCSSVQNWTNDKVHYSWKKSKEEQYAVRKYGICFVILKALNLKHQRNRSVMHW